MKKIYLLFLLFFCLLETKAQNDCATAVPITSIPFSSGSLTTCGTVDDYPAGSYFNADYGDGEDYVFSLTVSNAPVTYTLALGGTATWKIVSVHNDCAPTPANAIGGVTSTGSSASGSVTFPTNGTYYLFVDTWPSPNCGNFTLDITAPLPAPANDDCANAIGLTVNPDYNCGVVTTATTVSATATVGETNPTCFASSADDDVWFKFEATNASHKISLTTVSGGGDRVIQVYSGSCGSLVAVACSDPESFDVTGLTVGESYMVRVYTYSTGVSSTFNICVGTPPPTPANDEAANAIPLTVNADYDCGTTTAGYTTSATQSPEGAATCSALGINDDVWYSFVATNSAHRISFSGTTNTMVAALYEGTPGSLSFVTGACNSTTLNATGLTVGTTYYVRAYTSSTSVALSSSFNICVGTPPPPPANDICSGTIVIPGAGPFPYLSPVVNNELATDTDDPVSICQNNSHKGVWFSFTPSVSGSFEISSCQSDAPLSTLSDNVIAIYTSAAGCSGPFTQLMCNDDGCTTLNLQGVIFNIALTGGTTYYILVSAYGTNFGNIQLSVKEVTPLPPAPANDDALNAVPLTVNADFSCAAVTAGTTQYATQSLDEASTCSASGLNDDVWFSFVATSSAHRISFSNTTSTMAAALYTGTPGSLSFITGACANTTLNATGLSVGTTYYVRAYTSSNDQMVSSDFDICVGTPPPPPANDEAGNAIALTVNADYNCGAVTAGTTLSATQSADAAPTCSVTGINDDVWYSFVATNPAHRISFTGTTNTMVAALYTGTPGSLTFVTGACGSTTINATGLSAGTTYYVRAYTSSSTGTISSDFNICIGTPPPPPANDDCGGAIALTVNPDYDCGVVTSATTISATPSTGETAPTCATSGINDDVWFKFEATSTEHRISITNIVGTSTDMATMVYSGSCGSLVAVDCYDPETINLTGLTIGEVYMLRVYTWSSTESYRASFDICIGTPPPPPSNDDAPGAIALTVGGGCPSTLFSNTMATQSATEPTGSCSSTTGYATVWFSFVAPASGAVRISTDEPGGTLTDTRVALFSATDVNDYSTFNLIACDEDGGSVVGFGFNSVIYNTGLTPGATYYLQVDQYGSTTTSGTFCLIVDELNASMLSSNVSCATGQTPIGSQTGYTGWVSLVDNQSKLVALVRNPTGGSVGSYANAQHINSGAVRVSDDGTPYLDRNLRINNSSATNVEVQFFFLASELAALNAVDGTTLGTLGVSHQTGTTCAADFSEAGGIPTVLSQTGNGVTADGLVNWVTAVTPSFSNFYLHKASTVLPISLAYFNGSKQNVSKNLLNWKLECTGNNLSVVLEKSGDQQSFTAIHTVQLNGANDCAQPFSFVDQSAEAGVNYYRLRMVDADGHTSFSNIVALVNGSRAFEMVSLAPNPVRHTTTMTIASAETAKLNLKVTDVAGRQISTYSFTLNAGENNINLDFSKLAPGTYQITGVSSSGAIQTVRFVKQ